MQENNSCRSRNAARRNIRDEVRVSMRARKAGAVETFWSFYELRRVRLIPAVEVLSIQLAGDRKFLLRDGSASTDSQNVGEFSLVRYFKWPEIYSILCFRYYYEQVELYKALPPSLRFQSSSLSIDSASP